VSVDGTLAGATIRAASAADYPALCAAAARCGPAAQQGLPDTTRFAALAAEVPTLVAANAEAIVGYLLTSPLAYDGDTPVSLWIEAVAVVPGWRRRGLATGLWSALAVASRSLGVSALLTGPPADPALIALLAGVGFVAYRDGVLLWRLDWEESAVGSRQRGSL